MKITHQYKDAGLYIITLVITDDDSATSTILEQMPVGRFIRVSGLLMEFKKSGINRSVTAKVTVLDTDDKPVTGATVYGTWDGAYDSNVGGLTDADGTIVFTSGKVKEANATFTFTVYRVEQAGCFCDPECCVVSSDLTVP